MVAETVNVLGVNVSAINLTNAVAQISKWISSRQCVYVCVTGVHGVMESTRNRELQAIHNRGGLVVPDGMPLAYLCRLAGFTSSSRVYGPDLMSELCNQQTLSSHRHFFYGATPDTLAKLIGRLSQKHIGLKIVGCYSPPFRPLTNEESAGVATLINAANPDIVWVGLSTPKQELWMSKHRTLLNAPVLIGVGAAFDFHAGTLRQSPRWLQPLCLEWLFRLAMEPRRLWRRYLINNPSFLAQLLSQGLRSNSAFPALKERLKRLWRNL